VAAAGCAGSDDEAADTRGPATTAVATTTAATTGSGSTFDGGTEAVTGTASADETALLTAVDVGGHETYDRVVFRFENAVPGHRVEYVEPPLREDGSGNTVRLAGDAFLVVRMEQASGFDLAAPEGRLTYDGPRRLPGVGGIRELVRTGDFEAVLTWAIGLERRAEFRVTTLDNPARLVVDVAR
jgi:hypothetical protein